MVSSRYETARLTRQLCLKLGCGFSGPQVDTPEITAEITNTRKSFVLIKNSFSVKAVT
jgi:hypothetical protein